MNLWIEVDNLLWTSPVAVGWRWPETPPGGPRGGGGCGGAKHLQKKIFKKLKT